MLVSAPTDLTSSLVCLSPLQRRLGLRVAPAYHPARRVCARQIMNSGTRGESVAHAALSIQTVTAVLMRIPTLVTVADRDTPNLTA